MSSTRKDLLLLLLGCAVLFGLRLGARDLWNPNEPIYGEAVAEMAAGSHWLVALVNGHVFAEKPILFFWLALVAAKLTGGVTEASLRLPALAAALATVAGTYALVLPYAGRGRAVASALTVATLYGVWWNARFVQMDILVTATTLWAVVALVRVVDHGADAWIGFSAAGALCGIGFLAKGPVAWVCPALAVGLYLLATKRAGALLRREALSGVVACGLVAAPWFVALLASGHRDVVVETLFRQNVLRFFEPWDHRAPFGYYLESFWFDMAPWGFFLPLAFVRPSEDPSGRRLARLSWIWIVAVVAFFSLSRSKRSPYILPIAPAVAVLASDVTYAFVTDRMSRTLRAWVVGLTAVFAVTFAVAGGIAFGAARGRVEEGVAPTGDLFGGTLLVAGALVAVFLLVPRLRAWAPVGLLSATVLVYLVAGTGMLPALNVYKSAKPLCDRITQVARPADTLASYGFWEWRAEYRFYLRRPIASLTDPDSLRRAWSGPERVVLLVPGEHVREARSVIGDGPPALSGHVGSGSVYVFTNR